VNNQALTVVGVAPRGYEGPTRGMQPLVYVPLTMTPVVEPWFGPPEKMNDRRSYWVYLFARLRPGMTIEGARTGMALVHRPILADVEAPLMTERSAQAIERFKARPLLLEDGSRGQSSLQGETRTPLLFLFSITGLVVLLACANSANLLLARGATRATEMAVRLSLGASRARLIGQLLMESCLLAVIGGAVSLIVANITLSAIASVIPPAGGVGLGANLALDIRPSVLAFSAALSIGTGLLFGMFPALHSTRAELITAVRAGGGHASASRSASRFRTSLVTAQIALSMALLIAAGLFVRSLRNVSRVDLGMRVDNVVTFGLAPVLSGYDQARSHALFIRLEEQLRALPGVVSVAGSGTPLLAGSSSGTNVRVEGFKRDPDTDANTRLNEVGAGFFRTMQLPLIAGREFTPADRAGAPKVAIVNEAFAKKFNLGANPIGKRMARDDANSGGPLDIEIVGFVRDAKYKGVKDEMPVMFYTPDRQASDVGGMIYYVRTAGAPEGVIRAIEGVIAKLDPNLPIVSLKTMAQQVKESTYLDRMISMLSAAFAIIATVLTAVGLYGMLAYTVAQRTREIGLRMALGADSSRVRAMVLRQVGRMTLIGGAIGLAGALGIGRAAQSLLFGLDGKDPGTMIGAAIVIALVAMAAGYVPAWRASRVEPMRALRGD
jgi:predicted permease